MGNYFDLISFWSHFDGPSSELNILEEPSRWNIQFDRLYDNKIYLIFHFFIFSLLKFFARIYSSLFETVVECFKLRYESYTTRQFATILSAFSLCQSPWYKFCRIQLRKTLTSDQDQSVSGSEHNKWNIILSSSLYNSGIPFQVFMGKINLVPNSRYTQVTVQWSPHL